MAPGPYCLRLGYRPDRATRRTTGPRPAGRPGPALAACGMFLSAGVEVHGAQQRQTALVPDAAAVSDISLVRRTAAG